MNERVLAFRPSAADVPALVQHLVPEDSFRYVDSPVSVIFDRGRTLPDGWETADRLLFFGRDRQLELRRDLDGWRAVAIGAIPAGKPTLRPDGDIDLSSPAYAAETRYPDDSALRCRLWGTRRPGERAFAETRIPRPWNYPVDAPNASRAFITYTRYRSATTGVVEWIRFTGLEGEQDE